MNYYKEIKNELINNEITKRVKDYSKNRSDLTTYYNVGKLLSDAGKHYGEGVIKEYSEKLIKELGKKYSIRVLYKMLKFYNFITDKKLPTVSAKLTWSHFDELLKLKNINSIYYYMLISDQQNLSVRQLRERIKNREYERLDDVAKEKLIAKTEPTLVDFIKNNNNREIISKKYCKSLYLKIFHLF